LLKLEFGFIDDKHLTIHAILAFFFLTGDNILISSMMLQEQIQSSEVQLGVPKKEGTLESDQN
jgi:hypothetical protein